MLSAALAAIPGRALGGYQEGVAALEAHNCKTALREFSKAAKQGDTQAAYQLGLLYRASQELRYTVCKGKMPVQPDPKAAYDWFSKAAEKGHVEAQYQAAMLLAKDRSKGAERLKWLQSAAGQGHIQAQEELGEWHVRNGGADAHQNGAQAIQWLAQAAESGSKKAPYKLGMIYYRGEIVPRNYSEAVKWFHLGAERDDFAAQRQLAEMYEEGRGVPKNLLMAYYWYASLECSAQGGFGISHYLDRILIRLTADEQKQAQEMQKQWCQEYKKKYNRK